MNPLFKQFGGRMGGELAGRVVNFQQMMQQFQQF